MDPITLIFIMFSEEVYMDEEIATLQIHWEVGTSVPCPHWIPLHF
jgi:hypothetical protein